MAPPTDPSLARVSVELVALTLVDGAVCSRVRRRVEAPFRGRWALPGALVAGADLEASARGALSEVTGVHASRARIEQLGTYGAPHRDPRHRTVGVAWLAVLPGAPQPDAGSSGSGGAWRPVEWLLSRGRLAFDHRQILADGMERTRAKLEYSTIATAFLEPEFTVASLREVYEVVWGHRLDAGNFHRKVTRTEGFVQATGRRQTVGRGRPAELFTAGHEQSLHPPLTRRSLA